MEGEGDVWSTEGLRFAFAGGGKEGGEVWSIDDRRFVFAVEVKEFGSPV